MADPGRSGIVHPAIVESAGPTTVPPRPVSDHRIVRVAATLAAIALLSLWAGWWVKSLQQDRLSSGRLLWIPTLPFIAGDFAVHIDHTARTLASGGDVYQRPDDWVCAMFPYPPMIPRLFAWVSMMSPSAALATWMAALTLIFVGSSWAIGRTRAALGLAGIPAVWVLVAILYSTPVLFAMERGQCDPLILPGLGLSAWLMRRRSAWADPMAGALLGLTAWIKYYPGLAVVALLALRRWRALASFVLIVGGIGWIDLDGIQRSIANGAGIAEANASPGALLHPVQHSVSQFWPSFCEVVSWTQLADLPGMVLVAAMLLPAILVVGQRLDRLRRLGGDPGPLLWPTMLWLTATATFALPYSNDYNLFFLPLAILAVWGRRDPVIIPMAFGLLVLWWQPFELAVSSHILFAAKFLSLQAAAICLVLRIGEVTPDAPAYMLPSRPHFHWKALISSPSALPKP